MRTSQGYLWGGLLTIAPLSLFVRYIATTFRLYLFCKLPFLCGIRIEIIHSNIYIVTVMNVVYCHLLNSLCCPSVLGIWMVDFPAIPHKQDEKDSQVLSWVESAFWTIQLKASWLSLENNTGPWSFACTCSWKIPMTINRRSSPIPSTMIRGEPLSK